MPDAAETGLDLGLLGLAGDLGEDRDRQSRRLEAFGHPRRKAKLLQGAVDDQRHGFARQGQGRGVLPDPAGAPGPEVDLRDGPEGEVWERGVHHRFCHSLGIVLGKGGPDSRSLRAAESRARAA